MIKKLHFSMLIAFLLSTQISIGQITLIPDDDFEQELLDQGIDSDGMLNGQVNTSDINSLTSLIIIDAFINDMTGIQDFVALEELRLETLPLDEIDISSLLELTNLTIRNTFISSIDLQPNTLLEFVNLEQNDLSNIQINNLQLLEYLSLGNPTEDAGPFNSFETIDISANTALEVFECYNCFNLETLDVSVLSELRILNVAATSITQLSLSNNVNMEHLTIGVTPNDFFSSLGQITNLDLSANPNLAILRAQYTKLVSLNLQNGANSLLSSVDIRDNEFLNCVLVDDAQSANDGDVPYSDWLVDDMLTYADAECTLSIDDFSTIQIKTYPNPIEGLLNVFTPEGMVVDQILLYDVSGKEVLTVFGSASLDMRELPSGLYFAKISIGTYTLSRKLLKN